MGCMSQELKVLKISHDPNDRTSNGISRSDMNNNKCALLIVNLDLPGAKFYGNVIGEVTREKGNYLVYMSPGSKKLQVQHNLASPLRLNFADYGVVQVESGETYRLFLDIPEEIRMAAQAGIGADTKSPKHLSLFCTKDGQSYFFSKNEWRDLEDKETYNKKGLVIIDREEQFFIALEDYGEYTEQEIKGYLQLLPTEGQIQAIIDDLSNVQEALEYFGGQKLSEDYLGYYMVSRVDNELILGDTSFSWKFARENNSTTSQNRVRPASNQFQNVTDSTFNLPISITIVRGQIREARKQKDYAKALELCLSIPDDTYAQYYLGLMYELGQGVDKNQEEAAKWYKKGAQQDDSDCQYEIGRLYHYGEGVEKDYSEAIKWYKDAAENGSDYAQTALGFLYVNGEGVPQNYKEAAKWLTEAAVRGNPDAQNCLGWMYEWGHGVNEDPKEALNLYSKAAEKDHISAQFNLALLYYNGKGTEVKQEEAFKWWLKAAEQGNPNSQHNIGYLYQEGIGVSKDYDKAMEWYLRAANQGFADSQSGIGSLYEKGLGVPKDLVKAKEWYEKAAAQGFEEAIRALKRIAN